MFKKAVASVVIVMVALASPMGVVHASSEAAAATEATEVAEVLGLAKLGLIKHVAKKLLLLKAAKYGIGGGYGGIGIHGQGAGQIGGGININGAAGGNGYLRGDGVVNGNGAGAY